MFEEIASLILVHSKIQNSLIRKLIIGTRAALRQNMEHSKHICYVVRQEPLNVFSEHTHTHTYCSWRKCLLKKSMVTNIWNWSTWTGCLHCAIVRWTRSTNKRNGFPTEHFAIRDIVYKWAFILCYLFDIAFFYWLIYLEYIFRIKASVYTGPSVYNKYHENGMCFGLFYCDATGDKILALVSWDKARCPIFCYIKLYKEFKDFQTGDKWICSLYCMENWAIGMSCLCLVLSSVVLCVGRNDY